MLGVGLYSKYYMDIFMKKTIVSGVVVSVMAMSMGSANGIFYVIRIVGERKDGNTELRSLLN
ncbi:Uncharacterised protein [Serratia fonticola]|uniref:Uncharacterized protein n=1 Tax=Serratia fonticola TaxID=47917 RepID=A0A4U9TIG3_SERFO|nr:Uncharacterised protein [Serratia fonticola]